MEIRLGGQGGAVTGKMLSPSERLLEEILRISLSDDDLAISDVSISWTDIYGGRHTRCVETAPEAQRQTKG